MAIVVLLCAIFGLFIFFVSGDRIEDSTVEDLLEEWDAQNHLEDLTEDEELLLEEEQDAQELMDLLYLDEDEEVF